MACFECTFRFVVTPPLILEAKEQLEISWMGIVGNSEANLEERQKHALADAQVLKTAELNSALDC